MIAKYRVLCPQLFLLHFLQSTPLAFVFIINIFIRIKRSCFGFFSLERKDVQNFHFFKQLRHNSLSLYIDGRDQQDSM